MLFAGPYEVFLKMNRLKDSAKRRRFQKCCSNATWELLESQHTVSDWHEKSRRRKMIPKQDSGLLRNCLASMFCYDLIIFMLCELIAEKRRKEVVHKL